MVIYADVLFLINLVINYMLLTLTARICDRPVRRLLCLLSAAMGGVYSVISAVRPALSTPVFRLTVGILMVLCVFFKYRRLVKAVLVFFALTAAFGGAVYALALLRGSSPNVLYTPASARVLIFSFAICYGVISLVFPRFAKHSGELSRVEIEHMGRALRMNAITDTGNSLRDPITGRRAVVVGAEDIAALFDAGTASVLLSVGKN
ncbi:MAG: sigma-E processing peptidase SpoIIGA, partial [Oscillospiraceae bacterium]|nr:sigma-E processing peptidase SpoIIGA [Oscillospiraceae bacterium]